MATRSTIAIETTDSNGNRIVKSIYCHWDGYPENNGKMLQECYTDREKVEALIELGAISSLGSSIDPDGPHSFNSPQPGVTVAYHRDRGEKKQSSIHASVPAFFKSDIEEYGYLFTEEGEWLVKSAYSRIERDPVPLTYVLSGTIKL